MKIFLAGSGHENRLWIKQGFFDFYRLQTFFHITEHEKKILHKYKGFLLDSGAFSFFGGKKVDWNKYAGTYIDFINKYDIKQFFELDLYSVIGVKETEKLRSRIEKETGKQSIPVFHKMLGVEYYKALCENYKYIAISASGMYESKWTRREPERLEKMVRFAKGKGVKVHGLGYTKTDRLKQVPFYSVDSTAWMSGGRFGVIHTFNGQGFTQTKRPDKTRVKSQKTMAYNFKEWLKFQKYADENL
jgi:hypothetical protein